MPQPAERTTWAASPTQVKRRRNVLLGLVGVTMVALMLAAVVGGAFVALLFVLSAASLAVYVVALAQLRKRAAERRAKVRVLRPRVAPSPQVTLRSTASN